MTSIPKPLARHPKLQTNRLGLTRRDYEGAMSTLCAGCGHDSITAAIIQTFFELEIPPHRVAKLSGIGCSSKTPTYFIGQAHGFNSVHGRMPAIATGANAAHKDLACIGVSGDGDSLSIGLGQLCHAMRRNVNLIYLIENNGVYGLTKGQFSASADVGSKAKRGEVNRQQPIDSALLALSLGASFVARSFSGDKAQLVPILKAGLVHQGFALVDIISPCVTFNDHEGSTKSYLYTRDRQEDLTSVDFVPLRGEITADQSDRKVTDVTMHDGSVVRFLKMETDYDPTDRAAATREIRRLQDEGLVPTGLLYIEPSSEDMHALNRTTATPLVELPYDSLCPGSEALDALMEEFR